VIRDGKITVFTIDNTLAWRAKLEQALASAAPRTQIGDGTALSYAWMLALASVGLLGAGWALRR